jgi:hypothetical protein
MGKTAQSGDARDDRNANNASNPIAAEAHKAIDLGFAPHPPLEDGSKRPLADRINPDTGKHSWKYRQRERTTHVQADSYWNNGRTGLGIVTGRVSSGLVCLEFDCAETWRDYITAAGNTGMGELLERVELGCSDATPGGGIHIYVRIPDEAIGGNTKLACKPSPTADDPHRVKTLIETREEGGFIILAPSYGAVHPTGKPYVRRFGDLSTAAKISAEEWQALCNLARTFDEMPDPHASQSTASAARDSTARESAWEVLPGDDYNARARWEDVLIGWTFYPPNGETIPLKRPGKEEPGISAKIRNGRLNVYTSSTPFEPVISTRRTYDLFGAFALLNHGGDFSAAAKELEAKGYGRRSEKQSKTKGRRARTNSENPYPYELADGRICMWKTNKDGEENLVPLCNFSARILEQRSRDDGHEKRHFFLIEASLPGGQTVQVEIPAAQFDGMNWVHDALGARAIIAAGYTVKSHVRAAIQCLSPDIAQRSIYVHTGWRLIAGHWVYLTASGAIGANGLDPTITVELPGRMANYSLPAPSAGDTLRHAIRASLKLLDLGQDNRPGSRAAAAALLCIVYRAALGRANYSLQIVGLSGAFKTATASLALQHYGPLLSGRDGLVADFNCTVAWLEWAMHTLADTLFLVDDFAPGGANQDIQRAQAQLARIQRCQGNGVTRCRMAVDGHAQPARPPRSTLLTTGEDRCIAPSANARTLHLRFVLEKIDATIHGTIDADQLTRCQRDGDSGAYAASTSGFIRWVAPKRDELIARLAQRALELRTEVTGPGLHARTGDIVADLLAAFEIVRDFALHYAAISSSEADRLTEFVRAGLVESAADSACDEIGSNNPGDIFIRLVVSSLRSNESWLGDPHKGDAPEGLEAACGWRQELKWQGNDDGQLPVWVCAPNSARIGWTDGNYVYLNVDASYKAAKRACANGAEELSVSKSVLLRILDETGRLAMTDARNANEKRGRRTARVSLERKQENVIVLRAADFWELETSNPQVAPERDRPF